MSNPDNAATTRPVCVFIHGSGDDASIWGALIACLPQYTNIALDLPGHGTLVDSPGPAEMSVSDYAAGVRAKLAQRGLHAVCLVGHSLGSAIALRLAVDAPELVGRLVLVGGGARLRVLPALLTEALADQAATKRQLAEMAFTDAHRDEAHAFYGRAAPIAPGMLYRDLAACDQFDMMSELDRVTQPTLVLTGAEDRLTPPKYASFLAAHIPHAKFALIPDAGHCVQLEAPQAVADAMRHWQGQARDRQ